MQYRPLSLRDDGIFHVYICAHGRWGLFSESLNEDLVNFPISRSKIDVLVATVRNVVPLRVFALRMGNGASSELCERFALAGNGVDGEPLVFKAMRLINAMQTGGV